MNRWLSAIVAVAAALSVCCVYAASLRDPTRPPGVNSQSLEYKNGGIKIQAIVYSKETPRVLIDGDYLTIGDTIMGNKIVAIKRNAVILQGAHRKFTITMFNPIVKKYIKDQGERQ